MKPYFIYAKELDHGTIGINVSYIVTLNKGTVKTSGEEVTMVRMSTGKELVIKMEFEKFQQAVEDAVSS
jgi:hypothetical protein